jgi:hypothetical protein
VANTLASVPRQSGSRSPVDIRAPKLWWGPRNFGQFNPERVVLTLEFVRRSTSLLGAGTGDETQQLRLVRPVLAGGVLLLSLLLLLLVAFVMLVLTSSSADAEPPPAPPGGDAVEDTIEDVTQPVAAPVADVPAAPSVPNEQGADAPPSAPHAPSPTSPEPTSPSPTPRPPVPVQTSPPATPPDATPSSPPPMRAMAPTPLGTVVSGVDMVPPRNPAEIAVNPLAPSELGALPDTVDTVVDTASPDGDMVTDTITPARDPVRDIADTITPARSRSGEPLRTEVLSLMMAALVAIGLAVLLARSTLLSGTIVQPRRGPG